ncbi:MAG: DUF3987 domain-containing protein, partial [Actinomycetota bacterium]|nr:DUF3987 domain-containing protein [Actinomycetota bacterium]
AHAEDNGLDGVGLVFTEEDPFAFVDLDGVLDPETGEMDPGAAKIVDGLDSYTEISSSGRGLHVVVRGEKPGPRCKDKGKGVEMYDRRQYLAVSGRPLPGRRATVEDRGEALAALYRETFGEGQEDGPDGELPEPVSPVMEDGEIIERCRRARNGEKFAALYNEGDTLEHDGDHSSADLALVGRLAFYTQDPEQLDRLFRSSALLREKWEEREDYRDRTIRRALVGRTEFYGREYDPGEVVFDGDDEAFGFVENGAHDADDTYDIVTPGSSPPRAPGAADARDTRDAMTPCVPPLRYRADDAPFPLHALSPALRRYLAEAAHAKEAPVEFVAVPMLAALVTAVGASRRFRIERTWAELPTLYTAVVALPASGKSPAEDAAMLPVYRQSRVLNQEYRQALQEHKAEHRAWEAEAADARKKKQALPEEPEKPVKERIRVGDATVEALQLRMVENPRGLVLARDELAGFFNSLNQYRQGADREFWLSQHSGRVPAVDRKSADESYDIDYPSVSVVGSIQPDKLKVLDIEAGDGMVERFLFAWPDARRQPDSERDVSEEAEDAYCGVWERLYALGMGEDEFGNPAPRDVPLSPEAVPAWRAYKRALKDGADEPGVSSFMRGVIGKMKAHLPRLALILALVRTAEDGEAAEEVRGEDLEGAWELVGYFVAQSYRVYTEFKKENKDDLLAHALGQLLDKTGGEWEGTATELFDALKELGHKGALPKKPDALTQAVGKAVRNSPTLFAEQGQRSAKARSIVLRREYAS